MLLARPIKIAQTAIVPPCCCSVGIDTSKSHAAKWLRGLFGMVTEFMSYTKVISEVRTLQKVISCYGKPLELYQTEAGASRQVGAPAIRWRPQPVVHLWEMEAKAAIHAICLLVLVLLD